MNIELSICIPTYNRMEFISQTIDSVLSQIKDNVELVVSDNASTDETMKIINQYKNKHPNIIVHEFPSNMGADKNFQKVVELTRGRYCLLLGSDDVLKKGAIDAFLGNISESSADICIYARDRCDVSLDICQFETWWTINKKELFFDFSKQEVSDYFNICRSIGGVFSFISSIVFKRECWVDVGNNVAYNDTAYSHVYRFLKILLNKGTLKLKQESFVYCRLGNDSFLVDNEPGKRIALDIDGYIQLSNEIENENDKKAFLKPLMIRRFWYYVYLLQYKKYFLNEGEYKLYRNKIFFLLEFNLYKKILTLLFLNVPPLFNLLMKLKVLVLKLLKIPEVSM
ncbi:MAG: glycosyltransferase family 2 protein [gamma proteobacterium symbiont of Lucinoma myriamae]|nr:glycosyltransferase family 2 protein [gamma proteobacterium symbiont of Lucinoma myriamae]MCU7819398.1 glycosyltransferase family 2 protein [gamma proteobacterium symbiont of Lucinoma myriamae]